MLINQHAQFKEWLPQAINEPRAKTQMPKEKLDKIRMTALHSND